MMKTTYMTMAALAALSVAAPAMAQPHKEGMNHATHSAALQTQIDDGARTGAISRREMAPLRDSLRQLVRLERQFSAGGFSSREQAMLQQRSATLRRQINMAERSRPSGYDAQRDANWTEGRARDERYGASARFDRPNRGDRFAGDARIGQPYSARMIAVPARYREEFRDNDQVYYRYDDDRIYQVDRVTGVILRLLDISN
jgi:hypothetical protein